MRYSIQDFIQLIAQLRDPNGGCPWDLKQNYDSMIPCLTEETYEVIDAIQKKDIANLREELGDLLLQVVFFSQLASEDGYFTFDDVLNDVSERLYVAIPMYLLMLQLQMKKKRYPVGTVSKHKKNQLKNNSLF